MNLHPADWLARLPGAGGARYIRALRHGSMELELYAPRGAAAQEPHARDELYFVVSGQGRFDLDGGQFQHQNGFANLAPVEVWRVGRCAKNFLLD